jgi:DNA mismatch endonuclease (patch repair protein)
MVDTVLASKRSEIMAKVRHWDTAPELVVQRLLGELGVAFVTHPKELPGRPDLVLRAKRVVIRVHGCFWHGHQCRRGKLPATNRHFWKRKVERNRRRDARTARRLRALGWSVHTLWECRVTRGQDVLRRRVRTIARRR